MVVNKVYVGKVHKEPVKYLGFQRYECTEQFYHQFEYIIPKKAVCGYGQDAEQVKREEYQIAKAGHILYGR